jgi:membrane dipeptidase
LLELVLRRDEPNPFAAHWLPKLRAGGVVLQVCALFTGDVAVDEARAALRAQLDAFKRLLDENEREVYWVRSGTDLAQRDDARIGLLLSLEGVEALGDDPGAFAPLWDAGVRIVGLTHNPANAFAGGIDTPEQGLTDRGRALVAELADRGAIIDLAHASERTFFDILERAPAGAVMVSHAGCRAVHDVPRNVSDDQLRGLAERDGFLGLMTLQLAVGGDGSIDSLVDHVEHAVLVMGGERVGLGSDVIDQVVDCELALGQELLSVVAEAREAGGGQLGLSGLRGPEDFPALVEALRARGYEGGALERLLRGNLERLLARAALPP